MGRMKEGRPSATAVYVAFARAVATYEHELSRACHDDVAEALLPKPLAQLVARGRHGGVGDATLTALRLTSFGMFDHIALRTRVIDDALSQATLRGVRQLVILGAGLDARAHRLAQLNETVVFEVDHPSTQAMKQRKARGLPVLAKEIRYTACDFEHVAIPDALAASKFDPTQPSVWIWEGVTMYLPEAAVAESLNAIARLSAIGSRLITSYVEPTVALTGKLLGGAGLALLGAIAEPIRSNFSIERMAELLRRRGFETVSDVRPIQLAQGQGIRPVRISFALPSERINVADKRNMRGESSP